MITTVLFDLDGTLLPMDQDRFAKSYIGLMAKKMAAYGYDPEFLAKALWTGTGAMVKNDGKQTNEEVFWSVFNSLAGRDCRQDEPLFQEYYQNEFQQIAAQCGFDSRAAEVIRAVKSKGFRAVLATNPLFPAIATISRTKWAGLNPGDFDLITTYENSRHCKPSPEYYRDILEILNLEPENCVMVGNDVSEDMIARELGMQVFLLTDCMINKAGKNTDEYPQGSFPELLNFIQEL